MSKKSKKPATPAAKEKALKAARAEIEARLAKADAPPPPTTGEQAPKGDAGAKGATGTPHAGTSPATRAKGGKGKGAKTPKPKPAKKVKERKAGCLDAAATILADAKGALGCKDMVEKMLAKGLWSTSGKTPAATLYAAIIRDIAAKGKASRFRKTERGQFAAAGA